MARTSHSPGTFSWFECGTTDAETARTFYTELFGWNAAEVPMSGETGGHYTLLKVGEDDVAGLFQLAGPQFEGVPSHWATYVTVEDVDRTVERAVALGGETVAPPMDVPGVGRIAVLRDPTGATISLFKPGEHPGTAQTESPIGNFGWSELATRDTKRAAAFYTELFQWSTKADTGPMPYTEFQVGGRSIGGMMEMTPEQGDAPPHWLPYVMVEDCDATTARARALGATILVENMDIPEVGRFSVFLDPTGAALAIIRLTGQ